MVAAVKHATLMGNPLHAPDAICACRSLVPIYKNTPSATILVSTCFQQEVAVFGGRSRSKASSLNPLAYRSAAQSIRKHIDGLSSQLGRVAGQRVFMPCAA